MLSAPRSSLSQRILCRLVEAESSEPNPHYQDDYRIARVAVSYAACGEYKLCSPHVAASYSVLGLHPEKVWAALVARRKALCGAFYGLWFDQSGDRLEEAGVPKKPPRSERFEWEQRQRLKKAIGAELRVPRRLERVDTTAMAASTVPDYRESDAPESSKKSAQQWRLEIEQLIDSADFSREIEAVVVKRVDGVKQKVRCKRVYRRSHLNARLKAVWQASTSPYPMNSSKGEVFCYAALEKYAKKAKVCPSTLRSSLRELDNYNFKLKEPDPSKLGILVLVSKANSKNRPTTYQFNLSRLRQLAGRQQPTPIRRERSRDWHRSSPDHFSPPAQEAAASPETPPTTAAPVHVASRPVPMGRPLRSGEKKILADLFNDQLQLMKKYPPEQEALKKLSVLLRDVHDDKTRRNEKLNWARLIEHSICDECPHLPPRVICETIDEISQELRGHGLKPDEVPDYLLQRSPSLVSRSKREVVVRICRRTGMNVEMAIAELRGAGHEIPDEEAEPSP